VRDFYRDVKRRVGALPGTEHVAAGFSVPWRDDQGLNINFAFAAQGAKRKDGLDDFRARFRSVSPEFFATMGVPILEGRDFNDGDKDGSERVVIVSQSLAQVLYPGQNALNRKLWWTDGVMKFIGISTEPRRIIAVVPDFDDESIIPSPAMTVYQPTDQEGWNGRLFVRAKGRSLCACSRDYANDSRDVGGRACGASQHAGRYTRGSSDTRPPERDCVWRIRSRGVVDLRGRCSGRSCVFCE
jgi:hypothetical protein